MKWRHAQSRDSTDLPPSPGTMPRDTQSIMGTSGNVFQSLPAREGSSSALFENSRNLASASCGLGSGNTVNIMEHGRRVRREPQSWSIPTPRFNQCSNATSNPMYHTEGICFLEWCDGLPEISNLGNASSNIPRLYGISKLESQLQD